MRVLVSFASDMVPRGGRAALVHKFRLRSTARRGSTNALKLHVRPSPQGITSIAPEVYTHPVCQRSVTSREVRGMIVGGCAAPVDLSDFDRDDRNVGLRGVAVGAVLEARELVALLRSRELLDRGPCARILQGQRAGLDAYVALFAPVLTP
eukprot:scaffold4851_cov126-Isochrysis_galbana.AAC.4